MIIIRSSCPRSNAFEKVFILWYAISASWPLRRLTVSLSRVLDTACSALVAHALYAVLVQGWGDLTVLTKAPVCVSKGHTRQ